MSGTYSLSSPAPAFHLAHLVEAMPIHSCAYTQLPIIYEKYILQQDAAYKLTTSLPKENTIQVVLGLPKIVVDFSSSSFPLEVLTLRSWTSIYGRFNRAGSRIYGPLLKPPKNKLNSSPPLWTLPPGNTSREIEAHDILSFGTSKHLLSERGKKHDIGTLDTTAYCKH